MTFNNFKNIRVYALSSPITLPADELIGLLDQYRFAPCQAQDSTKTGFTNAIHDTIPSLAYTNGGCTFFAVKTQKKILPSQAVNDELQAAVSAKEAETGQPLSKKEKSALKEAVVLELLPRCLTTSTITRCYYDATKDIIVIGNGSSSTCEDILSLLRKAIGSLPALHFFDGHHLNAKMQLWGRNQVLPAEFELGSSMHFKAPDEEAAKARFDNHLLTHQDVQAHFEDKLAVMIELLVKDEVTLKVKADGALASIKFSETVIGQNDELGFEDIQARIDADSTLLVSALNKVFDALQVSLKQGASE